MNIKNKLKKSGGFTLIEMLIVVAIIAILVAVSIPMVSSNLDKAKVATDKANERAAKAAASITYMTSDTAISNGDIYYYDAQAGELIDDASTPDGYGQCSDHKDGYIKVTFGDDGDFTMKWAGVTGGTGEVDIHDIND